MHKISDEFEFRPDRTTDYGVSCPLGLKISHRLIMGKWCLHASSLIFDRIIIKVAGNQDRHKSLDELEFRPLVSMAHLYVFWNEIWPWHIGLRWAIVALSATCFILLCHLNNILTHLAYIADGKKSCSILQQFTGRKCATLFGAVL